MKTGYRFDIADDDATVIDTVIVYVHDDGEGEAGAMHRAANTYVRRTHGKSLQQLHARKVQGSPPKRTAYVAEWKGSAFGPLFHVWSRGPVRERRAKDGA